MTAQKKVLERQRFVEFDHPSLHVWDVKPGSTVEHDLREHMRTDGRPDLWKWHVNTKVPRDAPVPILIADQIDVPERLRPEVGKAPCPLCSLCAPKFFHGVLTWWPQEKALRVIGVECAIRYFGDAFRTERVRYHASRQGDADFSYLIDHFPLVGPMRAAIRELAPTAEALDRLRGRVLKGLSKRSAADLLRHAGGGELVLYDDRQVPEMQVDGQPRYVLAAVAVSRVSFDGWRMLAPVRENASALLMRSEQSLKDFDFLSQDEFLEAALRLGHVGLKEMRSALIDAARRLKEAHRMCGDIQAFLAPVNLDSLLEWSFDHRAMPRLDIKRDQFGGCVFVHKPHSVSVPRQAPELTRRLPDIAFIQALKHRTLIAGHTRLP